MLLLSYCYLCGALTPGLASLRRLHPVVCVAGIRGHVFSRGVTSCVAGHSGSWVGIRLVLYFNLQSKSQVDQSFRTFQEQV
jgi:hypothetical protein